MSITRWRPEPQAMNTDSGVDKADLTRLAESLYLSTGNVYTRMKSLGIEVPDNDNDEIFTDLKNFEGIFRCESCSVWKSTLYKDDNFEDMCDDCSCGADVEEDI